MAFGLISITSVAIDPSQSLDFLASPNLSPGIVSEQRTWTSSSPMVTVAISFSCRAVHEAAPLRPSWPRAYASTDSGQLLQQGNDFQVLAVICSRRLSM